MGNWKAHLRPAHWLDPSWYMEKWDTHKWKFGIKACQALDAKSFGEPCLVTQLCLTLCDPMDYSLSGSSVHGIYFIHFFSLTNSYSLTNYCEPALVLGSRETPKRDMVPGSQAINYQMWRQLTLSWCLYLSSANEVWMRCIRITEKGASRSPGVYWKGQKETMASRRNQMNCTNYWRYGQSLPKKVYSQRHRDEREHGSCIRLFTHTTAFYWALTVYQPQY